MGFSELPVEFTAAIVPEPGTAALVLAALAGLVAVGRGRRDRRLGDAIPGSNRVGVLPQTTPRSHRKRTTVDRAEALRKECAASRWSASGSSCSPI